MSDPQPNPSGGAPEPIVDPTPTPDPTPKPDPTPTPKPDTVTMAKGKFSAKLADSFADGKGKERASILADLGVESLDDAKAVMAKAVELEASKGAADATADYEAKLADRLKEVDATHAKELKARDAAKAKSDAIASEHAVTRALVDAAAKGDANDPEEIASLLKGRVALDFETGRVRVFEADGKTPDVDDKGEALTVDGLVSAYLTAKPHHVKSNFRAGSGSKGSDATGNDKTITRTAFEALPPQEKHARMRAGTTLVD